MAGLKVNFSDQELSSEGRTFEPIPTGEYYVRVTGIEEKECGPESKNPGKPYWAIQFTVQDGEHEDRKLFTNAMLFEGALYTIVQLMKACGFEKELQAGNIPPEDKFISKECIAIVKKVRDKYAEDRDGDGTPQFKNEVKGIKKYEGQKSGKTPVGTKAGAGSLLP